MTQNQDGLAVFKGLSLPRDAITQTFGILARKGAGKTYAAGKLVEELLRHVGQVIVLDPVGTWYGLRLSADGKRPGFPIAVFGGLQGDVPLQPDQGERLAQLLIEEALSGVVDVSSFRKAERKRFVADFCERLFHEAKRARTPRMLVLEEAQVFAPQRAQGEERMLGAVEDLVRLGRNYGIGVTMLSQRPQSVNKECLNQVECLLVGQLNAVHERKAIEDWVIAHGADRAWVKELPELPVGHMVLWSPGWLRTFQKVEVARKVTYDASATPVLGASVATAVKPLSTVDVEALRAALAPPAKKHAPSAAAKPPNKWEIAERGVLERELADAKRENAHLRSERLEILRRLRGAREQLGDIVASFRAMLESVPLDPPAAPKGPAREPSGVVAKGAAARPPAEAPTLRAGILRMLAVLATFHPGVMTKKQIASAARMKVTGGTFGQYWGTLMREKLIAQVEPSLFRITDAGLERLGSDRPEIPADLAGRLAYWSERLRKGERAMLNVIVEAGELGLERAELAELVNMAPTGGSFGAYLGTLTRNRLIEQRGGKFFVHPWLSGKE